MSMQKYIREQLRANEFELPEELLDEPVTNLLYPESDPEGNWEAQSAGSNRRTQESPSGLKKASSSANNRSGNVTVLPSKKSSGSMRGVRGDRVRGGGSRVTSSVALERHQIRQSPGSSRRLDDEQAPNSEPKAEPVGKRHSMNIIDDGTIETLDSKAINHDKYRRVPSNSSNNAAPPSEEKVSHHSTRSGSKDAEVPPAPCAPVNYDDDVDEIVEEEDGEDWYEEDFDEDIEAIDADAKSTEESVAVMRLQSFAVKKQPAANHAAEAKMVEAGIEESKEEAGEPKDEWDLDPEVSGAGYERTAWGVTVITRILRAFACVSLLLMIYDMSLDFARSDF
mgnify:CR=1 FL=1